LKKLTKVAILGFPNVGKSTLFNRLLKKKKSLVHSLPGMTRDMVSDVCQIEGKSFTLIDTGGFFDSQEDIFSSKVREKAWDAARDADAVLFVLDGKRAMLPAEEELFFSINKLNKPILVVVNKIDSPPEEEKVGEFFRLGQDRLFCVSAEHKRNIEILESGISEILPSANEVHVEKDVGLLKIRDCRTDQCRKIITRQQAEWSEQTNRQRDSRHHPGQYGLSYSEEQKDVYSCGYGRHPQVEQDAR